MQSASSSHQKRQKLTRTPYCKAHRVPADSRKLRERVVKNGLMDGNKPDKVLPVTLKGCECNEAKASAYCKSP